MEKYIGCKIISAEPMYKNEAVNMGYCRLNDDEKLSADNDVKGYHVCYEDGYNSWSPADVFEKAYHLVDDLNITAIGMNSSDYKERFIAEYKQLKVRKERLENMLKLWDENKLQFTPTCRREIYDDQIYYMDNLMSVLINRAKIEHIELS